MCRKGVNTLSSGAAGEELNVGDVLGACGGFFVGDKVVFGDCGNFYAADGGYGSVGEAAGEVDAVGLGYDVDLNGGAAHAEDVSRLGEYGCIDAGCTEIPQGFLESFEVVFIGGNKEIDVLGESWITVESYRPSANEEILNRVIV